LIPFFLKNRIMSVSPWPREGHALFFFPFHFFLFVAVLTRFSLQSSPQPGSIKIPGDSLNYEPWILFTSVSVPPLWNHGHEKLSTTQEPFPPPPRYRSPLAFQSTTERPDFLPPFLLSCTVSYVYCTQQIIGRCPFGSFPI